jgi:hypothetical protein
MATFQLRTLFLTFVHTFTTVPRLHYSVVTPRSPYRIVTLSSPQHHSSPVLLRHLIRQRIFSPVTPTSPSLHSCPPRRTIFPTSLYRQRIATASLPVTLPLLTERRDANEARSTCISCVPHRAALPLAAPSVTDPSISSNRQHTRGGGDKVKPALLGQKADRLRTVRWSGGARRRPPHRHGARPRISVRRG